VGTRVGTRVALALREPDEGVFSLSSGANVGLGVLVTWIVGGGVSVGLETGLSPSESLPKAPQLSVKNSAKAARTANLDTIQHPSSSTAADPTLLNSVSFNSISTPNAKQGNSVTKGIDLGGS